MLNVFSNCDFIDISQPISTTSDCFPGDTPFSFNVTMSHTESKIANVTSLTMSPHVGTHADAPNHIEGDLLRPETALSIGRLPLKPYVGPVTVIDLTSAEGNYSGAITVESCSSVLNRLQAVNERVLFKTRMQEIGNRCDSSCAYFNEGVIEYLAALNVSLVGIDTPSVDAFESGTLGIHHLLLEHKMYWLENLELTHVEAGEYCLVALPLKFTELEASPVRAVLLSANNYSS